MVASPQSPLPCHLAKSFYLHCGIVQASTAVPAVDEVAAAGEPVPACDRAPRGSQPVVRPAYPVASHNQSRCAGAACCSDPRRFELSAAHLPASAGVSGRMHSLLSDLCHLSNFPFDCG